MKKLLMVMICAALLLSVSGMAELKLGDCAVVANCNEYISLRSKPSKNAKVLERIHLNDTVNVIGPSGSDFVAVEAGGKYGYVLAEYLELYDDYSGECVQPGKKELYNLNLFLSNFSEQDMRIYNEFDMIDAWESDRNGFYLDFAIQHVLHNRPDLLERDDSSETGARLKKDYLPEIIHKYFKTEVSNLDSAEYSQSGAYYYLSPAECEGRRGRGFVSLYSVDALGDSRYAVRFETYGANEQWNNDVCRLNSSEAARKYEKSGEGLAVIVIDGDGTYGTLTNRSTWRLERWVTSGTLI